MKKLDFVIGKWEGEGWLLAGPDQRCLGILTARPERQKPDGTWYVSLEFRMRKID